MHVNSGQIKSKMQKSFSAADLRANTQSIRTGFHLTNVSVGDKVRPVFCHVGSFTPVEQLNPRVSLQSTGDAEKDKLQNTLANQYNYDNESEPWRSVKRGANKLSYRPTRNGPWREFLLF